jgi:adenylate cyclase class IV
MKDIETTIYTVENVRISIDEWDDGGAWLGLQARGATMNAVLTRAEAEKMLNGLQAILAKKVTA